MTTKLAKETMTGSLITIGWNEPMKTAYNRMRQHGLRHLPALDDSREIVGMVSDRDVQRAMVSQIDHKNHLSSESIEFDPEARVRDYMAWPVLTVDEETDLKLVAERMLREKISSLLVQRHGQTVGILTTDDLLKVLVDLLRDPRTPARWTLQGLIDSAAHRFDGVMI